MSHNVIKTARRPARGHGSADVLARSRRRGGPVLRLGGSLVAATLMVACAGCLASHGRRCDDQCGIRSQTCGTQPMASCRSGACAPEVWRAGYRSTHWRPLVTECECVNSSLALPSTPIHSGGEDIPLPQPAVIPLQDELLNAAPPSAKVDWEPLLPQTMPVMGGRDNNAEPVTLHRQDGAKSDDVLQAHGAAPPPSAPRILPARPATSQPEPRPTGILPTTLGPPDDPFESQDHPDPADSSAAATAVYVPLAWLPTERSELQFKEIP